MKGNEQMRVNPENYNFEQRHRLFRGAQDDKILVIDSSSFKESEGENANIKVNTSAEDKIAAGIILEQMALSDQRKMLSYQPSWEDYM